MSKMKLIYLIIRSLIISFLFVIFILLTNMGIETYYSYLSWCKKPNYSTIQQEANRRLVPIEKYSNFPKFGKIREGTKILIWYIGGNFLYFNIDGKEEYISSPWGRGHFAVFEIKQYLQRGNIPLQNVLDVIRELPLYENNVNCFLKVEFDKIKHNIIGK